MVWQDMPFVGMVYPFENNDFISNVEKEVKDNILKLHTHPSFLH